MIKGRNILLILMLLGIQVSWSQGHVNKAYEYYKVKAYDSARVYIDSAIISDERLESQTWQLRGLIYKGLSPDDNETISISVESFVQARTLNPDETDKINGFLKNSLIQFYNNAVVQMNAGELTKSEQSYYLYRSKYLKYLDPNFDFKGTDVAYYNALGNAYSQKLKSFAGDEKIKLSEKAVAAYNKVLAIDPTNYEANVGAGIAYYNLGADIITQMTEVDTPLDQVQVGIEKSIQYFNAALPHLQKAYEQNPENKTIVEGLAGTYLGLQDDQNFQIYFDKLEEMEDDDE